MNRSRWLLLLACAAPLSLSSGRAAVLLHEYALRGSLNDNLTNTPLTAFGGQITALGYTFAANQGLALASPTLSPVNYSLEFSFRLNSIAGGNKLIDFKNLTSNDGLYVQDGRLGFFPTSASGPQDIAALTNVHVVLTRDNATSIVSTYVNGAFAFSFTDSNSIAVANGPNGGFRFFIDDLGTHQSEAGTGTVNYLRFFNGALTGSEVSALYAAGPPQAVPEPSTLALLAIGGIAMAANAVRRRFR